MQGMSPFALPIFPPMHSTKTSSCSLMNFCALFPGMKTVMGLPFFTSWILAHLRIAELGCFASICTFSSTIPFAWLPPSKGSALTLSFNARLMYHLLCQRELFLLVLSFFPAIKPFALFPIASRIPAFFLNVTIV